MLQLYENDQHHNNILNLP